MASRVLSPPLPPVKLCGLLSPQTCRRCCRWTSKGSQDLQGSPDPAAPPAPLATQESQARGSQACMASPDLLGPLASRALGNPASQDCLERRG